MIAQTLLPVVERDRMTPSMPIVSQRGLVRGLMIGAVRG
jgi:hypothetical protein